MQMYLYLKRIYKIRLKITCCDVFVKFDSGNFFYHGTSKVHSYSFLKTGTTTVTVKVQIVSSKKEIKAALNIFDSGPVSLV